MRRLFGSLGTLSALSLLSPGEAFRVISLPQTLSGRSPFQRESAKAGSRLHLQKGVETSTESGTVDSRAEKIAAFEDWLIDRGFDYDECGAALGTDSRGGIGLFATKNFKTDEPVLKMPEKFCLGIEEARKLPNVGSVLKNTELENNQQMLLALLLVYHKQLGKESPYFPWLELMPSLEEMNLPFVWSEEERKELQSSTTKNIDGFIDGWNEILDVVTSWGVVDLLNDEKDIPIDAEAPTPKLFCTREEWYWAVSVILSRSTYLDGSLRLCPLMDFCNHSPEAVGEIELVSTKGFMNLISFEDAVQVKAQGKLYPGEEVLCNYGKFRNAADYLMFYGFVPPKTFEMCEFVADIDEDDRFIADKEGVMEDEGQSMTQAFDVYGTKSRNMDPALIQFLRFRVLGGKDAFLLEPVFFSKVWTFMRQPVTPRNEAAMLEYLQLRLDQNLREIEETERQIQKTEEKAGEEEEAGSKGAAGGGEKAIEGAAGLSEEVDEGGDLLTQFRAKASNVPKARVFKIGNRKVVEDETSVPLVVNPSLRSDRAKMMGIVRAQEKIVLRNALEWCHNHANMLANFEYYHERRLRSLGLAQDPVGQGSAVDHYPDEDFRVRSPEALRNAWEEEREAKKAEEERRKEREQMAAYLSPLSEAYKKPQPGQAPVLVDQDKAREQLRAERELKRQQENFEKSMEGADWPSFDSPLTDDFPPKPENRRPRRPVSPEGTQRAAAQASLDVDAPQFEPTRPTVASMEKQMGKEALKRAFGIDSFEELDAQRKVIKEAKEEAAREEMRERAAAAAAAEEAAAEEKAKIKVTMRQPDEASVL